jgi:hypothetical protein
MEFESPNLEERDGIVKERFRRGLLSVETVQPDSKAKIIAGVLAPPQPGLYMEIGPAGAPYSYMTTRQFDEHTLYLGVDGGRSAYYPNSIAPSFGWVEYGSAHAHAHMDTAIQKLHGHPNQGNAAFIWADAQQLPLPDADQNTTLLVRETFMRDVFLDAGIHPNSMQKIMQEQARIMGDDGVVIVRETTFTGYHTGRGGIGPRFLHLIAALHDAGFTRRIMVFDGTEGFDDLIRQFPGGVDDRPFPNGYYLICGRGGTEEAETAVETTSFLRTLRQRLGRFASMQKESGLADIYSVPASRVSGH